MTSQRITSKLSVKPNLLFLVDGLGALVSVVLLGVVLVKLEFIFGIPAKALYLLASIPCLFAFYDFYCYKLAKQKYATFLKGIAIANLSYCCISIAITTYHYKTITLYGWSYILIELIIVFFLAQIELNTAKALKLKCDEGNDLQYSHQ